LPPGLERLWAIVWPINICLTFTARWHAQPEAAVLGTERQYDGNAFSRSSPFPTCLLWRRCARQGLWKTFTASLTDTRRNWGMQRLRRHGPNTSSATICPGSRHSAGRNDAAIHRRRTVRLRRCKFCQADLDASSTLSLAAMNCWWLSRNRSISLWTRWSSCFWRCPSA
jgi:hypothetical protein